MKYKIVAMVSGLASNVKEDMNIRSILPAKYNTCEEARKVAKALNESCETMVFLVKVINN